jgi:hypothetical protein
MATGNDGPFQVFDYPSKTMPMTPRAVAVFQWTGTKWVVVDVIGGLRDLVIHSPEVPTFDGRFEGDRVLVQTGKLPANPPQKSP